jgi:hypothetical protein
MDRFRTARNIGIVLAIAAIVHFVPGGGRGAVTFEHFLYVLFGIAIGFIVLRTYRERRVSLSALGDRGRGLLYFICGLVLFLFEARWWFEAGGLHELIWFVLAGLGLWAAGEVYRQARSYG